MKDPFAITAAEAAPYVAMAGDYIAARQRKDYATSDALRTKLLDAGVDLESLGDPRGVCFNHLRESPQHRRARVDARG